MKEFLSNLQPVCLTFIYLSLQLLISFASVSMPYPCFVPGLPALLLLIPPFSSFPAEGGCTIPSDMSPVHIFNASPNKCRVIPVPVTLYYPVVFLYKPYSVFCSCFPWPLFSSFPWTVYFSLFLFF